MTGEERERVDLQAAWAHRSNPEEDEREGG